MDKVNNNVLAAMMIEMEIRKLIEQDISEKPWADVDKTKLPKESFLWIEDPEKKSTWHLPYREGTGGIDSETGVYKQAGAVNLNALRAISQAVAGARTGQPMKLPAEIKSKINKLLKKYKIGKFAERQEGRKMEVKYYDLRESTFSNSKINHDSENCIIQGMAILGPTSKNCSVASGKGRKYSEQALLSAAVLVNNTKSYINHATREELEKRGGIRDIRDLLGFFENGRIENGVVRADLHYLKCHESWFGAIVDQMPDKIGGSIHAYGPSSYDEKTLLETVQDIKIMRSVDVVTEPGSTNNLFESLGRKSEDSMEINTITLKDLRESRPDLIASITNEYKESEAVKKAFDDKDNKIKQLEETVKNLKEKLDGYEVKEAVAKKIEVINKKINDSKMPKELITETFRESLMRASDEKEVDALIADRNSIVSKKLVTGMGEANTFSESWDINKAKIEYAKSIEGAKVKTE